MFKSKGKMVSISQISELTADSFNNCTSGNITFYTRATLKLKFIFSLEVESVLYGNSKYLEMW